MIKLSKEANVPKLDCPLLTHWISFRLVDEHGNGNSYAGLRYILHADQGQRHEGNLDDEGFARIANCHPGPVILDFSAKDAGDLDSWYDRLINRKSFKLPLTALQVAAEQPASGPRRANGKTYLAEARASQEGARFFRVEVSDFAEAKGHLPAVDETWQPKPPNIPKRNAGIPEGQPGIVLMVENAHYVLEVKALRAYSPLFSRDKHFCALNAYHLAVMSTFAYAPFSRKLALTESYESSPPPYSLLGSIGHVLQNQLGRLVKPTQFNTAGPYHLLCEEVPYSKRLEIMPYDPERYVKEAEEGWKNPEDVHFLYDEETSTQAFITHNDKMVLISVRGTQEMLADTGRDLDARQVPYEGIGQAHRGFHGGFLAVRPFVERYLEVFYTAEHTIIVCGHSLGGAIALLLAEWIRRKWSDEVQLYTYGAPRAGDRAFVQAAQSLTHHRIVNHDDPIPALPLPWMDAEWKLALSGTALLFSSPVVGIVLLLAGLVNLHGDLYEHHGEQQHFMPRKPGGGSEAAILWQPGCALIDEQTCARYVGEITLDGDMPKRIPLAGSHHSSDSGYARAALTTLLRWHDSVEKRAGALFTDSEIRDIYAQVKSVQQLLESWQPRSFNEFRWEVRRSGDMRFYGKSDLELRAIYADALQKGERLRDEQEQALSRAQQRLLAQAERLVTPHSVFGEHAERADVAELVAQWRALKENQAAERLAGVNAKTLPSYA
ncbi:lipase family protein [Stutzerimonas nitrititolerans]|uniref:lipase family protein n=1 Tax=Stutzerimonas nitrititolerans TaxID=2482751 RepID=UPI0028AEEE06|nr:lipase family protein [Stutzerimonas nitrititolerans]